MRYHVTNQSGGLRRFASVDRFLTLANGETENNVELTDDGVAALRATNEFRIVELDDPVSIDDKSDE